MSISGGFLSLPVLAARGSLSVPLTHVHGFHLNLRVTVPLVQGRRSIRFSCARPRPIHESKLLQWQQQRGFKRYYSESSTTENQARRFGRLVLKSGVILSCCWFTVIFASALVNVLYPPQLTDWDTENHLLLVMARMGIVVDRTDVILHSLTRAWINVRNASEEMLRPNSSVRFLNVVIWLSDELERAGRAREAYKVLCDAIRIYRSRYQRHSDNNSTAALDSHELVERRYLISILSKLTVLSEKFEPTAEGKWLSSAVREMIPLLPVRQGLWKEVYGIIEQFATAEPSFSDISSYLQSHSNLPTGPANSKQTKEDSTTGLEVSAYEVIPDDEYLFLPFWCASDVPSAIAIPLKHIGIFAEKHGHSGLAYNAYTSALRVSWLRGAARSDSKLEDWEYGFRALEYCNYRTDFMFRHLDIAFNPDDWRYLEHHSVPLSLLQILKRMRQIEKKIPWMQRGRNEKLRTYGKTFALTAKHKAIFLEKLGKLDEALKEFQSSIELWELSKRPTSNQEIQDIQGRIERVKRRIVEGDTYVDDQVHPDILMSWKGVKKRVVEAKVSEDGGVAT